MTVNWPDRWAAALLTGAAAGLLSGLFGVGGGIIMVPALVYLVGLDQIRAHGTSLAAVMLLALSSGSSYALAGKIDWHVAALLALGSTLGAWTGARLLHALNPRIAALIFTLMLVATAMRLFLGGDDVGARHQMTLLVSLALVLGGVFAGLLAGLLGVGGGAILVPMMIVGLGVPTVIAKGTSLAVIVVSSVVGTIGNRRHANVDLPVALLVGFSGVVSAYLGGRVSLGLPDRLANRLFAALLVVVATKMAGDLYRNRVKADPAG